MNEKKISVEEFDAAVNQVMDEIVDNPAITGGMTKLLIPLTGALFAGKMRAILFKEDE